MSCKAFPDAFNVRSGQLHLMDIPVYEFKDNLSVSMAAKDNWLVNGLFDYYLSTNSLRAIEVLAGVREPHDKHLLDRLAETLGKSLGHGQRVQALTLLGHVARRQPTWLHKLASHALFRELLKLLKVSYF